MPIARVRAATTAETDYLPVVLDDRGGVLHLGRTRRLATPAQRRALSVRDRGCCFPGCDRPPAWTEVHHVREWQAGGTTDLDNLCLLCAHHHATFRSSGWQLRMTDGTPEWVPPPWLDPSRTPVRNDAHVRFDPLHPCAMTSAAAQASRARGDPVSAGR